MDPITALTNLGTIFLEVTKELREHKAQKKADAPGLAEILKALRRSIKKLVSHARRLAESFGKKPEAVTKTDRVSLSSFVAELRAFNEALGRLDLTLLEIYYPEVVEGLSRAAYLDNIIVGSFQTDIPAFSDVKRNFAELYGTRSQSGQIKAILSTFQKLDQANGLWAKREMWMMDYDQLRRRFSTRRLQAAFSVLAKLLEECQAQIDALIREKWEIKELGSARGRNEV